MRVPDRHAFEGCHWPLMRERAVPNALMSFPLFLRDDTGAVTVDWTVLAAAVVGIGLASAASLRIGVADLGRDINSSLSAASVAGLSTLGAGGAAEVYEHTLLSATQATYDRWLDVLDSYSDAALVGIYQTVAAYAVANIGSGSSIVPLYIDLAAAIDEKMRDAGVVRPDDSPSVEGLVADYNAARP